ETNSDVSALKRSHEVVKSRDAHLSSLLDTVPDAMVVIADKGVVLSFSTAADKLFGLSSAPLFCRHFRPLLPPPSRAAP
ncbi:PAS domain S-box protein, partial [Rhizobium ruizarguesonis]